MADVNVGFGVLSARSAASSRSVAVLRSLVAASRMYVNAHRGVEVKVEIGGPRHPEGEPGQGVECLPERLGRGAVYRPAHDTAPEEVPLSMRSP